MMNNKELAVSPIIKPPFRELPKVDFTKGFDVSQLRDGWGIGGYNEKRENMYIAPQYLNKRNIHMGIDIWAPADTPVYSPVTGTVAYTANHNEEGNYGTTIVLSHTVSGKTIYALYGHLSVKSLENTTVGKNVKSGEIVGWLGDESENGNWYPHLHYQMSWNDPGEADMKGVVSEQDRKSALEIYPDPEEVFAALI